MNVEYKEKLFDKIEKGRRGFPLTDAFKDGNRFYHDFQNMINYFNKNLKDKDIKNIINKILGASNNEQQYLQTISELVVVYYCLRKYDEKFNYEPKYNGGYNPECSFCYEGITINIEVKCPDMSKRICQENTDGIKWFCGERIPNYHAALKNDNNSSDTNMVEITRMENKLKDYLISAHEKFPDDIEFFNILVIALETLGDVDEWYEYIFGAKGVFTDNSFIPQKVKYDSVDAILLCTPVSGIKAWKEYTQNNVLDLDETVTLLLFNPRKESTEKGKVFLKKNLIDLFGPWSKKFQLFLRQEDEKKIEKLSPEEKVLIKKGFSSMLCSLFFEYEKKKGL
jgi:hypothetical protein